VSARIPCINPSCRRTAPADSYEPGEEIICRGCWRLLPPDLAARWKRFNRRERRLIRRIERRVARNEIPAGRVRVIGVRMEARRAVIWSEICAAFRSPEKPVGLDAFLRETGLG